MFKHKYYLVTYVLRPKVMEKICIHYNIIVSYTIYSIHTMYYWAVKIYTKCTNVSRHSAVVLTFLELWCVQCLYKWRIIITFIQNVLVNIDFFLHKEKRVWTLKLRFIQFLGFPFVNRYFLLLSFFSENVLQISRQYEFLV